MCQYIDSEYIVPGWGCCQCHLYNGMQRTACRGCGRPPCAPLQPDDQTGTVFENRVNHLDLVVVDEDPVERPS
mgnify:CR=1 FL=1